MSKNTKIILFLVIGLMMLGLVLYGLFYSKKLDKHKETSVESNINDYLYDEAKDTIDIEEEEIDLDGDEVVDEDEDFEVYEEEVDWGDEYSKSEVAENNPKSEREENVVRNTDGELEELYDNTTPPKKEPITVEEAPKVESPSSPNLEEGNYLVIVGSFGSMKNAKRKIKELEKAGFKGEITQLGDSKLHTVIAGRFAKEAAAEAFAQEIKDKKLKAFVKEN